ncbi:GntR family transcriptional regulator [Nitratireductor sp. ZSWI3]|uniref:GntR family transcriptional regulator n=1 Tax=Nitratireductor sp. ZSWI3 TaxID=2966359 RepID=UPI0021501183|nr:FCD domain-containing protein [Nitratireductor sp. ZSWI3]MCR4267582.1 FCD domain-containing protein [Nitratireductor sp. ZSWI3]
MRTGNVGQPKSGTISAAQNGAETLAEVAYRRLREDIVHNVFTPGQPLRLELLKQRYGLSFSPLREALNRLQMERLVVTAALRGFSVAPVSIEEMWDATETRILIECEALKRSIRNGDDDWEAAIVSTFHALDLQVRRMERRAGELSSDDVAALESRHKEFHHALIAYCGSRRLIDLANQLYTETQRYRLPTLTGENPATSRDIPREHREIMDATLARRSDEAAELLAAHYRKTSELIESSMSGDGAAVA